MPNKRPHLNAWCLMLPALLPGLIVFLFGLYVSLRASLGWLPILKQKTWTLQGYINIVSNTDLQKSFLYTLIFASVAASLALTLGSFLAWALTSSRKRGIKSLGLVTTTLAVLIPYGVMAQATQVFWGQSGFISRIFFHLQILDQASAFPQWLQTPFGLGLFYPYVIKGSAFACMVLLPHYAKAKTLYENDARTLGAKGIALWLKVYHGPSGPTLAVVGGIIFAYSYGAIEVPLWLGALKPKLLPAHFHALMQHPDLYMIRDRMAFVILLALTGLAATIIFGLITYKVSRALATLNLGHKSKDRSRPIHAFVTLTYSLLLILPLLWLVVRGLFNPLYYPKLLGSSPKTINNFLDVFGQAKTLEGLKNGLIVACATGLYISFSALFAGRALSKYKAFKGRSLALVMSGIALVLPAIVTITGTIQASIKLGIYGSHLSVIICHVVMTLPYAVAIQTMHQNQIGKLLEATARTLGAHPLHYITRVHLPLIVTPFFLSFSLGFLISFTETFSSQLVGAGNVLTLGALMVPTLAYGDLTRGSAYMVIFITLNGLLFYWTQKQGQKWQKKSH